jgi:hypothetical protein
MLLANKPIDKSFSKFRKHPEPDEYTKEQLKGLNILGDNAPEPKTQKENTRKRKSSDDKDDSEDDHEPTFFIPPLLQVWKTPAFFRPTR